MQPITYSQLLEQLKNDLAPASNWWKTIPYHGLIVNFLIVFGILMLMYLCLYTVRTQRFIIIERFGKYHRTAGPGLHFRIPFIDRIACNWSLQIYEKVVEVETITSDKVTVVLEVPVQFHTTPGSEYDAYYKLSNISQRIESLVFDEVRSRVPKLTLDQLFNSKDEIATYVRDEITSDLKPFGYGINRVMITDVEPEAKVKAAMNDVNAAHKEGEAALARALNEQKVQVAQAEGRLSAAQFNKQAELIDAEAVSKSVEIIGTALHKNEGYMRWQWIRMMEKRDAGDTIYVPTEANLPILEAGKRQTKSGV